jgi:acyl carrier protein
MQDRNGIRKTLLQLMENDTGEEYGHLEDDTKLREGLGLDSVDIVSIISQIERRFRIRLTHQELATMVTVGDLLSLLEVKIQAPPADQSAAAA